MLKIELNNDNFLKAYNLDQGIYAPAKSFCCSKELLLIANHFKLKCGSFFPLPILLQVKKTDITSLAKGSTYVLTHEGKPVGEILVEEIFSINKEEIAKSIFGTADKNHPGVNYLIQNGDLFIAGTPSVYVIPEQIKNDQHYMSPEDVQKIKVEYGMQSLTGFQTRNIPHRAHEALQRQAMTATDGILIQPLVGWKKPGDFSQSQITKAYQALINEYYPKNRVIYNHLHTPMFYAGPREAIFHAIIRSNFGCTHFIVGRDHAGVGNFYGLYEAHELCEKYQSKLTDIQILRFRGPYYCTKCESVVTDRHCGHKDTKFEHSISGTKLRLLIENKEPIPSWMARREVIDSLND